MKNSYLGWFILCYALFNGNFISSHADPLSDYSEVMALCKERMNVSIDQFDEIESTSEGTLKLINGDGDFRDYGCYVACTLQESGWMTGNVIDFEQIKLDHEQMEIDISLKARYNEIADLCASSVAEADDECDVALSFSVCALTALKNL